MNKQAFAFLTLFTLILMLSIYYVTLPADQGQLNPDQLLTGQNEDQDSHLTRTEVVVHPVGPESGEADRQIQYRPNNAIPGNGSFQIH